MLKIAYVVETFTEGLGYIDNILPRELSRLEHEVHVLTCDLSAYYDVDESCFGYAKKIRHQPLSTQNIDGFTVHWQPYYMLGKRLLMGGLHKKLMKIHPDIVVVRGMASFVLGQVVFTSFFSKFKIFTSTGQAYSNVPDVLKNSVFCSLPKLKNFFSRKVPGRFFSFFTEFCVGSTSDCVDCAVEFYGIPRKKTAVISLGVDTDIFYPVSSEKDRLERVEVRRELGVAEDEILCIWTGRLTPSKGVDLLSSAVQELRKAGHPFRALFIGDGPEECVVKSYSDNLLLPFMQWSLLPAYYRAADIAVWPRSITTSTLDAAACGLPIIMSSGERAVERWKGNGLVYEEGSLASLVEALLSLEDSEFRSELGQYGQKKMTSKFSWAIIAQKFIDLFLMNGNVRKAI